MPSLYKIKLRHFSGDIIKLWSGITDYWVEGNQVNFKDQCGIIVIFIIGQAEYLEIEKVQ